LNLKKTSFFKIKKLKEPLMSFVKFNRLNEMLFVLATKSSKKELLLVVELLVISVEATFAVWVSFLDRTFKTAAKAGRT
jgi:hypothetical protein